MSAESILEFQQHRIKQRGERDSEWMARVLEAVCVCVCFSIILRSARWPEESAIYYSAYGLSSTQLILYMICLEGALCKCGVLPSGLSPLGIGTGMTCTCTRFRVVSLEYEIRVRYGYGILALPIR